MVKDFTTLSYRLSELNSPRQDTKSAKVFLLGIKLLPDLS